MKLEKGMVFEYSDGKYLVLEIAKDKMFNRTYIVVKSVLDDNDVWCIDEKYLTDIKIWGEL